jgi:hypothetical protein
VNSNGSPQNLENCDDRNPKKTSKQRRWPDFFSRKGRKWGHWDGNGTLASPPEPRIIYRIVTIESNLDVLAAFDFNGDEFLCIFLGTQSLKALGKSLFSWRPSIVLIDPL